MMGKLVLIILWCFSWHLIDAQEFHVRSFRCLSNDITAWVDPVRDLNDEACALIKVVGDPDFVFSTPLGVVARREEVGEIWLYVPRGTMKLTIKHPRWGGVEGLSIPGGVGVPFDIRVGDSVTIGKGAGRALPEAAEEALPGIRKRIFGLFASSRDRRCVTGW